MKIKAGAFVFSCQTPLDEWRVRTAFTKEPGTVRWIKDNVREGDVFYDIGANVGIYSLLAAGRGASVYAFEPHVFNAATLLTNINLNGLGDRIRLISSALHIRDGFRGFNYKHAVSGSSGSQLGHVISERGEVFRPAATELKHATTIDRLVGEGAIPAPALVKIDVDGNEALVLAGMDSVLPSVRSIQVETHPGSEKVVREALRAHGLEEMCRHLTALGQEAIDQGIGAEKVFANVVFGRAA